VAGGDTRELALTLTEPEPPEVARAVALMPPTQLPPPEPKLSRQQRWSIGLLSSGAAVGLTGLGIALMARSAHDDYDRARAAYPGDPDDIDEKRDRVSRTSIAADSLFA